MLSIVPIQNLVALRLIVQATEVSEYRQFKKKTPCTFYFLRRTEEESTGFEIDFDFRFSMDLYVLRCPEHD